MCSVEEMSSGSSYVTILDQNSPLVFLLLLFLISVVEFFISDTSVLIFSMSLLKFSLSTFTFFL